MQVFVNLLLNAKEAISEGGTVEIKTLSKKKILEIQISDTGRGVEPNNLDKIFNPFFSTRKKGTGLGLAIASQILEQHQAKIFVESEVGKGTKFTIKLAFSHLDSKQQTTRGFRT